MEVEDRPGRLAPQDPHELGQLHFARHVPEQAIVPGDDDLGRPLARLDPEDLELDRQPTRLAIHLPDEGVDPLDERAHDLDAPGMVPAQFAALVAPNRRRRAPTSRDRALLSWISAMVPVAWRRQSSS